MENKSEDYFSKDYFFGKKNSNYQNYNHWDNDKYWAPTIKDIRELEMEGRVLDIGCAFGFFLKRLEPYFDELHGIDISDYALKRASKEVPNGEFQVVDINGQDIPYPNEYFNLITAFDVLEHTESIERSLEKIVKKLKKGGYLIISLPLKDTWAGKLFNIVDKDESHISVPKEEELFNILEKVGLTVVKRWYFWNMIFFKIKGLSMNIEVVLKKEDQY